VTSRYFLGLLGHPLGHSYSPLIHHDLLELAGLKGEYKLFDYTLEQLETGAISSMLMSGVHGFNVTIPYKVLLHDKLPALTPAAKRVGAVNTVFRVDVDNEITLIGHNTDSTGFYKSLTPQTQETLEAGHAIVLGGGGSARAVLAAMIFEGKTPVQKITLVMRHPEKANDLKLAFSEWVKDAHTSTTLEVIHSDALDATRLASVDVLVNCTPVGMHPDVNATPLSLLQVEALNPNAHVVDLIYNPSETVLMKLARDHGCPVVQNGLGMLIHQAIEAFSTWTKLPAEAGWYESIEARLQKKFKT
jgi:shikimate dehydrogenase